MVNERKRHDGSPLLAGGHTFLLKGQVGEIGLTRSAEQPKGQQIANVANYRLASDVLALSGESSHASSIDDADPLSASTREIHDSPHIAHLQTPARGPKNVVEALTEAVQTHSLGQIKHALYDVDGEWRGNM